MPSFDIVSEVALEEVRNAVENAERELATRFDFRGAQASFVWENETATFSAESEFQLEQMEDILRNKLVKRGIDVATMELSEIEHSGKTYNKKVTFKQGIEAPVAKKLVKLIKDKKLKVQPTIQGEQVRVSGKKRDDLQATMAVVREADLGQPFQFQNFRD